ncbi:MAG TPA: kelch repeat-containing protein [Candidatus Limnocylindrales bacterium]|nr:kelch repeat-containing protein [Candidatus Limnocylindrales bacterium]
MLASHGPTPAAREDHTWTVDPGSGLAYLFGGRDGGTSFDDLWSFHPATDTWKELTPEGRGPAARFGHEAAWVPGLGLAITLGQAGSSFFDDVWLFDPEASSWRQLSGDGERPVPRYGSCSGIGPDGRLWISHGFTEEGTRFFDTRAYDFETGSWSDETPPDLQPVERCLHTCWWTGGGDFVLYGGQTTGVAALGDLWLLEGARAGGAGSWMKLEEPALAARQLPAVARRGALSVAFGGRDIDRQPLGDTWLLPDPGGAPISRLDVDGEAPDDRSGAALVYDEARDRMLLFGGIGDEAFDDLWELSFD